MRCWETAGRRAEAAFSLGWDASGAVKVDLLERRIQAVEVEDGTLRLELGPFEIATVIIG